MVNLPPFDKESIESMVSSTMGWTYDRSAMDAVSRQVSADAVRWRRSLNRKALFGSIVESLKCAVQHQFELKAIYIRLLLELQILADGILIECDEGELRQFASEVVEVDTTGFTEELFVTYAQVRARLMEPSILQDILLELSGCGIVPLTSTSSRLRLIGSIASIGTDEASDALSALAGSAPAAHERRLIGKELLMLRDPRGAELEPEESVGGSNQDNWSRLAWSVYFDNEQGSLVFDISNSAGLIELMRIAVIIRPHLRNNRFPVSESMVGKWWIRLLHVLSLGRGNGDRSIYSVN